MSEADLREKFKRMIDHIINERGAWHSEFDAVCANGEELWKRLQALKAENELLRRRQAATAWLAETATSLDVSLTRLSRALAWTREDDEQLARVLSGVGLLDEEERADLWDWALGKLLALSLIAPAR